MSPDRLVHMANQIALNFAAQGEARALPQIAGHVNLYWDPRMRAEMAAHLDAGGSGMHPLALRALTEGMRRPQ